MTPVKTAKVGKHIVEEFYWNGRYVVYVDNHLVQKTYTEAYLTLIEDLKNDL